MHIWRYAATSTTQMMSSVVAFVKACRLVSQNALRVVGEVRETLVLIGSEQGQRGDPVLVISSSWPLIAQ